VSKKTQTTEIKLRWDRTNVLDHIPSVGQEDDAKEFRELIHGPSNGESGESTLSLLNVGQILRGTVVSVLEDFIIVDVGLKSEGLISKSEFTREEVENELIVGHEVEVYLDQAEGEDGQIVLSKEKARKFRAWEDLVNNCKEGSIREGKVLRKVKGGLMVDIAGMEAFLPGSQIDSKRMTSKMLDDFVGTTCKFKILKINIDRKNVVVSRREIQEEERVSRKAELLEDIIEGTVRKGIVKNITDFGVFLDLDGIDGLLHITDMSWKRLKHPSELVHLNQELEVLILSVDKEKGRVALGLKQKDANPYEQIEKKYPAGTKVRGKIVNQLSYGAFLEIEPGVEGLIHVSEMSWTKQINDPSEMVRVGEEVEAIVLSIQKEDGKISLGIKQLERNPWEDVERKYPVGSTVVAEIRNLTNYGAFVELEPGVDGLIHISDLSWIKKVSHPSEVLKKGDKAEAVILSVDKESKKITLGVKQLSSNPWETIEKSLPIGSIVTGIVTKTVAFGAFVQLDNGIEALIHVNELSDNPFAKLEDVVAKGDKVTAKVIKIDPDLKKIALSRKEHLMEGAQLGGGDEILVGAKAKRTNKKKATRERVEDEDEE